MATINDVLFFNSESRRQGKATDCLKSEFIDRNLLEIMNAIFESEKHEGSKIQITFFPKKYDRDFAWRSQPKKYVLTLTDNHNTFISKTLK